MSKSWRVLRQIPGYALIIPYSLVVGLMIPVGLLCLWAEHDQAPGWVPAENDEPSLLCDWQRPNPG